MAQKFKIPLGFSKIICKTLLYLNLFNYIFGVLQIQ